MTRRCLKQLLAESQLHLVTQARLATGLANSQLAAQGGSKNFAPWKTAMDQYKFIMIPNSTRSYILNLRPQSLLRLYFRPRAFFSSDHSIFHFSCYYSALNTKKRAEMPHTTTNFAPARDAIVLDGRTLELHFRGGQLLRTSTVLSALLEQPLEVNHVRGNRSGKGGSMGGLKAQHIACISTLAKWSSFNTGHLRRDDKEVSFTPRKRKSDGISYRYWTEREFAGQPHPKRTATVEIAGVGSIMLLLQAILPYILYNGPKAGEPETPLHLTVMGGTHVSKAPTADYFTQVFVPMMKSLGYPEIEVTERRRGWSTGPTIPGEMEVVIPSIPAGKTIPGFAMQERGEIIGYDVTFIVPEDARRSFRETVNNWFEDRAPDVELNIIKDENSGHNSRFYLLIVAKSNNGYRIGRDWIWDRKSKDAFKVAADMVRKVWGYVQEEIDMGGCVDHYLQDQLIVYQILAEGDSVVNAGGWGGGSLHAQTVRWVGKEVVEVKWDDISEEQEEIAEESKALYNCRGVGLISSTGEGWE